MTEKILSKFQAGLPCMKNCADIAEKELESNGSILKVVQYYLLSGDTKKGLDIGLKFIKGLYISNIYFFIVHY